MKKVWDYGNDDYAKACIWGLANWRSIYSGLFFSLYCLVCCHLPTQLYLVFVFPFLYNEPQEACILRIRLALQATSLATDQADGVGADGRNAEQDGRRKKMKLTGGKGKIAAEAVVLLWNGL